MEELLKTIIELPKSGATDFHVNSDENAYIRKFGKIAPLPGKIFTDEEIKKFILATSTPKAREILGKTKQVNYSFQSETGERLRIAAYFSRGKFSISVRNIRLKAPKMEDLDLPEGLRKALSKQSGLIIVGSPSGQGKTTTISAIIDFLNTHFERNIITIENPVEILFKDDKSSIIQRSIPLDVPNFWEGLKDSYRLDPDVVVTDSLNYPDAFDQALFLCESGCLVIGAMDGGNCPQILERILFSRSADERVGLRSKLTTHLSLIISQKLVEKSDVGGMTAVYDILVNTLQVKALIRNENFVMLKSIQEQDHSSGMQTFDRHILSLVKKKTISMETAISVAEDAQEMSARFSKKGGN
ncbi:MAG: Flp pilus assembly complex ATPase component TadA [Candidatus Riflebacteria bacterium]|nr:Flp pilus assembly complex ATPase component TadA [Candidatus Riflebacteria bacterium]